MAYFVTYYYDEINLFKTNATHDMVEKWVDACHEGNLLCYSKDATVYHDYRKMSQREMRKQIIKALRRRREVEANPNGEFRPQNLDGLLASIVYK